MKNASLRISHNQIMRLEVSDFIFFSQSFNDWLKRFKIAILCLGHGFKNASLRFDDSSTLNK